MKIYKIANTESIRSALLSNLQQNQLDPQKISDNLLQSIKSDPNKIINSCVGNVMNTINGHTPYLKVLMRDYDSKLVYDVLINDFVLPVLNIGYEEFMKNQRFPISTLGMNDADRKLTVFNQFMQKSYPNIEPTSPVYTALLEIIQNGQFTNKQGFSASIAPEAERIAQFWEWEWKDMNRS